MNIPFALLFAFIRDLPSVIQVWYQRILRENYEWDHKLEMDYHFCMREYVVCPMIEYSYMMGWAEHGVKNKTILMTTDD